MDALPSTRHPLPDSPDSLAHLRTVIANHGAFLGVVLAHRLRDLRLGSWCVELRGQEGPSTGSGVRARQNLVLVSRDPSMWSFVIGSVCGLSGTAQARSYHQVAAIHQARMKLPCAFGLTEHASFLADLAVALACGGIKLASAYEVAPVASPPRGTSGGGRFAAGLLALATLSALWFASVTPLWR